MGFFIKSIDLLKVDVEGAELQVLRGAKQTLGVVKAVLVEYNEETYSASRTSAYELRDLLTQMGFRWCALPWRACSPKPVDWDNLPRICDLMAVRQDTW